MEILPATLDDVSELASFIHLCFRGDAAKDGWTRDTHLIEGIRVTPEMIKTDIENPGGEMLKVVKDSEIVACMYTQITGDKIYLGALSVRPDMQGAGLGNKLMAVAEERARKNNCAAVQIEVIKQRAELLHWYDRKGFKKTGKTSPFPTDGRFGIPKIPLEFVELEKEL